jgi:hypothetical protein
MNSSVPFVDLNTVDGKKPLLAAGADREDGPACRE